MSIACILEIAFPAREYSGTDKKRGLGNEGDVNMTYNYTEDVTFGVSLGWFASGDALKFAGATKTASQAMVDLGVKF